MSTFVSRPYDSTEARPPGAVVLNHAVSSGQQVNYSVVVIVVVLSVVIILSGFLHLLARCLGRRRRQFVTQPSQQSHRPLVSALHGQLQHLFHLHDAGVDQAFITTLPVFAYGSIRGLKDSADCAVCLTEFADDDHLRLLPKCKHAFHLECIDTWLLSHSTCPLCRHSLLAPPTSNHHHHGDHHPTESVPTSPSELQYPGHLISTSRTSSRISSLHGSSYRDTSFRIGEPPLNQTLNSELQATHPTQEIEELIDGDLHATASPDAAPTIRVVDEHGTERVLKLELGRARILPHSDTRKLEGTEARSYSLGSYEYVVDATSWPELTIAPTPYPGRPNQTKPSHRSALSDSVPELASSPELFWTSRGVVTPHSRSRVRCALLTPIASSAASSPFLDLCSDSPSLSGDRWIDIDLERGAVIDPGRRLSTSGRSSQASPPSVTRSVSLGRMGESRGVEVAGCRRSLSEKLAGRATATINSGAKRFVCDPVVGDGNGQQPGAGTARKFSLHWLMGRDQRVVFSAASPSPVPAPV